MAILKKIWKLISLIGILIFLSFVILLAVAALPLAGNYKLLTVLSGSMEPAIHTGSVVVMAPAKDYKIGDVITFDDAGRNNIPTTHRINDIKIIGGSPVYITKGDANNTPDGREITQNEIDGKVLFSIPYLGYVFAFMKKPLGFALLIIIPALLIIGEEGKNIYRELEKNKKKGSAVAIEKTQENQND